MSGVDSEPVISAETRPASSVASNNPCPFLRALVAGGHISGHVEQLSTIADTVVAAGGETPGEPRLPKSKVYLIAMIANGLGLPALVPAMGIPGGRWGPARLRNQ